MWILLDLDIGPPEDHGSGAQSKCRVKRVLQHQPSLTDNPPKEPRIQITARDSLSVSLSLSNSKKPLQNLPNISSRCSFSPS